LSYNEKDDIFIISMYYCYHDSTQTQVFLVFQSKNALRMGDIKRAQEHATKTLVFSITSLFICAVTIQIFIVAVYVPWRVRHNI